MKRRSCARLDMATSRQPSFSVLVIDENNVVVIHESEGRNKVLRRRGVLVLETHLARWHSAISGPFDRNVRRR